MYSDHFLVAEINTTRYNSLHVHLVDSKSLKTLDILLLESYSAGLVEIGRLLRPRLGIELFWLVTGQSLQMCCKLGKRLSLVNRIGTDHQIFCLVCLDSDTWIVGGEMNGLKMIEIHFPEALKL